MATRFGAPRWVDFLNRAYINYVAPKHCRSVFRVDSVIIIKSPHSFI